MWGMLGMSAIADKHGYPGHGPEYLAIKSLHPFDYIRPLSGLDTFFRLVRNWSDLSGNVHSGQRGTPPTNG